MPFLSVVLETCDDGCLSPFPHWGPRMLWLWFHLSLLILTKLSVQGSSLHCRCVDTLATLYSWMAGTLFLVLSYCFSKDIVPPPMAKDEHRGHYCCSSACLPL